jgi:type II secretory pathway pseudopilin PulG
MKLLVPRRRAARHPGVRRARPRSPGFRLGLGFTILELMLAIGIFALVLTAIYAIWVGILRGTQAGMKAAAEVQRSRVALRALEDAFTSAEYFMANMKYYLFLADTSGDMAAVSIAARLPASFPGVGRYGSQVVRRVSFYTEPGKDGSSDLIMSQHPILLATNSQYQAYTITLARDVSFFQLAFYDDRKGEWLDEWKSTNTLPRLVQIALGLGKNQNGKPSELVYSLVALPSVGVTPDVQAGRMFNQNPTNRQPGAPGAPGAPGTPGGPPYPPGGPGVPRFQ